MFDKGQYSTVMYLGTWFKRNESRHEIATLWYVRPAKPQISLRIRAVWSEPLLIV